MGKATAHAACVTLVFVSLLRAPGAGAADAAIETLTVQLPVAGFSIARTADGRDRVHIPGFGTRAVPGQPLLPEKLFTIAIPPDAAVRAVRFAPLTRELADRYDPAPAGMLLPSGDNPAGQVERATATWTQNYRAIYESDEVYPTTVARVTGEGTFRRYRFVQVSVTPWQIRPRTGRARYTSSVSVDIDYVRGARDAATFDRAAVTAERDAAELIHNYAEARAWYPQSTRVPRALAGSGDYSYLVLCRTGSEADVQPLVEWKRNIGYRVKLLTLETIEADATYAAFDRPGKIRAYLRDHYLTWGSQYLLIVGDTDRIPMRECVVVGGETNVCYTDQYYGELSRPDDESWDADGDGVYGEYPDDSIDWAMELYVGRIPDNTANEVLQICQAMRDFEMDTGAWKRQALFCTALFDVTGLDNMPGVPFTDAGYIAKSLFDEGAFTGWSTRWGCEAEGVETSPLAYDFGLSLTTVENEWNSEDYALVNFAGHGDPHGPLRLVWDTDGDGNGMAGHGEYSKQFMFERSRLNTVTASEPSIVYFCGCNNGRWDDPLAIAKAVLHGPAVAAIGSTMPSLHFRAWQNPTHGGGDQGMQVIFNRLITGAYPETGKALGLSKTLYRITYGDSHLTTIMCHLMNLYGDPSLRIDGVADRANLARDWPAGWTFPVVPRTDLAATASWCPASDQLPGFALSTYFSYAIDNTGTVPAYDVITALRVDGEDIRKARDWNWIDPGLPGHKLNLGPYAVHGGRHTVSIAYDPDDTVLESSEADNVQTRQFVWSPYTLARDTGYWWADVPYRGNLFLANCEGFATGALPFRRTWGAIGLLPQAADADHTLRLHEAYENSGTGYALVYAESRTGPGRSEIVLYNTPAIGTNTPAYPGVFKTTGTNGACRIQWTTGSVLATGTPAGPFTMESADVIHVYQLSLSAGFWQVELTGGTADKADLGLSVYAPGQAYVGKADTITGTWADGSRAAGIERYPFRAVSEGTYAVAVWKTGFADGGQTATYTLTVTENPLPPKPRILRMLSVPSQADRTYLEWGEYAGWSYGVAYSKDLAHWREAVRGFTAVENGPRVWIDDGTHTGGRPDSRRFYRVFSYAP